MDISWWLDGVLQTAVGGLGVLINLVRNLMPRFCAKPRTLEYLLHHCTNTSILVGRPIHVLHDTVTRQIAPFLFLCSGIDEKTEAREQHSFCHLFFEGCSPRTLLPEDALRLQLPPDDAPRNGDALHHVHLLRDLQVRSAATSSSLAQKRSTISWNSILQSSLI